MNYVILQTPGHNRVYYNSADKLALAELTIASQQFSTSCSDLKVIEIANIRYLSFETEKNLADIDIHILSRLSFIFALFEVRQFDDKIGLIPINKTSYEYIDSKISSLLKYKGKTNELFTKMMINVALLSSDFKFSDKISMLDPVSGKGTTLFEGTVYGFDVYGVEIEQKSVHETIVFFKNFLKTERFKHNSSKRQISGTGKSDAVSIQEFEYAHTKQDFKSKDLVKKFGMICGNSQDTFNYFKKELFHLLVGDLPYGIVHGNAGDKKTTTVTRNPSELLSYCLPEWRKVLKIGGVVVVAWNSFLVSRKKLAEIFAANGFEVLAKTPYNEFEHMVDKSIKRDIVVAKKIKQSNNTNKV